MSNYFFGGLGVPWEKWEMLEGWNQQYYVLKVILLRSLFLPIVAER